MTDGSLTGYIKNQFSLDEYNGALRIATTETGITGIPSNNVFCLDSNLNIIGSLRNIAQN
jgi:inhibitor of cysteine peptidase